MSFDDNDADYGAVVLGGNVGASTATIGASSRVEADRIANDHHDVGNSSWKAKAWFYLQHHWKIIVLGQLLSFLLASGGAAQATLHLNCDLSAPTFTMATIYFVLSFHWVWLWYRQRRIRNRSLVETEEKDGITRDYVAEENTTNGDGHDDVVVVGVEPVSNPYWDPPPGMKDFAFLGLKLQRPAWQYLVIAFLDAEAQAITVLAYRYTTLTSVSLFDALAVPSAMILSGCFFGRQYTWVHILGVVASMAGVIVNIMQDYSDQIENKVYPHKTRGDILAITGGLLYGLVNTLVEVTVRHNGSTTEYLAMVGIFGFCITMVQSLIFESGNILEFFGRDPDQSATCSLAFGWWLFFVFVAVNLVSYMGASQFLIISEAAYFSLSLLTGDLWSLFFSIVAEHIVPQPLFFVALIFVLSGVVVYEMAPSPVKSDNEQLPVIPIVGSEEEDEHQQEQYDVSILTVDSNES